MKLCSNYLTTTGFLILENLFKTGFTENLFACYIYINWCNFQIWFSEVVQVKDEWNGAKAGGVDATESRLWDQNETKRGKCQTQITMLSFYQKV